MNHLDPEQLRSQLRQWSGTSLERAISQIEDLAKSVDAVNLFIAVVANLAFVPEDSASEATHGAVPAKIEMLAYYLYPFFGIPNRSEITPLDVNKCTESLDTLLTMRVMAGMVTDRPKCDDNEVDRIAALARGQAEIVRGSAYPEQTAMEISAIQGYFDSWFSEVVGIFPTRATAMLWAIIRHQEDALNLGMPDIRACAEAARKHWQDIEEKPAPQRNPDETRLLEVFENDKAAGVFAGVMARNLIAPHVIPVGRGDLSGLEPLPTSEPYPK